jgi:transcriptional regulator with XRE-family HTH domain
MTDISFTNWASLSDKSLTEKIGIFVRHHRMEQNLTQEDLAIKCNISRSTLSLLERGETVTLTTLIQVLRVLDQLAVMNAFEVHESVGPLELAKLQRKKRQRASSKSSKSKAVKQKNKTDNSDQTDW